MAPVVHVGTEHGDVGILSELCCGNHLVALSERRDVDVQVRGRSAQNLTLWLFIPQIECNLRGVCRFFPGGGVVKLEKEPSTGLKRESRVLWVGVDFVARRIGTQANTLIENFKLVHSVGTIGKSDDVVQNGRIACFKLDCFDPDIFFKIQRNRYVAIVLNSGRRDLLRRNRNHHIRLTVGPLYQLRRIFGERIGVVCVFRPVLDPVNQCLGLFNRNMSNIAKVVNVLVINLARRHALGVENLADHGRPALDHLVAVHGEGCDSTFHMAAHAALFQNRCDVIGVGNVFNSCQSDLVAFR